MFVAVDCDGATTTIEGDSKFHDVTSRNNCEITVTPVGKSNLVRSVFSQSAEHWNFKTCESGQCIPPKNVTYYYQVSNSFSNSGNSTIGIHYMDEGIGKVVELTASPQKVWSDYGAAVYPTYAKTSMPVRLENNFSVSAQVNVTALGGWQTIFSNSPLGAEYDGIRLVITPEGLRIPLKGVLLLEMGNGTQAYHASCPYPLLQRTWVTVKTTFLHSIPNTTTIALYVDGTLCQKVVQSNFSPNTNQPISWGYDTSGANFLLGQVRNANVQVNGAGVSETLASEYWPVSGGNNLTFP
jgi:hypothetical protein